MWRDQIVEIELKKNKDRSSLYFVHRVRGERSKSSVAYWSFRYCRLLIHCQPIVCQTISHERSLCST